MSYPQIVDYNEAVQHPTHAFFDPELRGGAVKENNLGLPLVLSGGFALTYSVNTIDRKFAVRCFHREIPSLEKKYEAIAATLKGLNSPYFVDFDFQQQGIKIRRDAYPIVRMDWVEGDPLGIWLDKNFDKPKVLQKARDDFAALAVFLESEGIAHGDLQNGNVMLSADGVKLIDYDGMFVPNMEPGDGSETGHKHFQHPDRSASDYGPQMDRFSFILLDLSLQALIHDASLYRKFREGGETIVFKANDFANPQSSEIFRILLKSKLKAQVRDFAAICDADISVVPTLADFRAGRNIPNGEATSPAHQAAAQPRNEEYIAPFPVVDARDFAAASQRVGDRVELIGKIVEVNAGNGKWGKTQGHPYLSMNFGASSGEVVKISILSKGLSKLVEQPGSKLIGRWASVTGLIEPSQGSRGRNRAQLNITIEQGDQMALLTEAEAQFRLASIGRPPPSRNRTIVKAVVATTEAPIEKSASPNRNIVGRYTPNAVLPFPDSSTGTAHPDRSFRRLSSSGAPPVILPALHAPPRHMPPKASNANAVARWMWISAGIMLCLMLIEPVLAR